MVLTLVTMAHSAIFFIFHINLMLPPIIYHKIPSKSKKTSVSFYIAEQKKEKLNLAFLYFSSADLTNNNSVVAV